jgi:hypothetical protein
MTGLVDLRNANAGKIMFENRGRVIEAISEPGKPNDIGRTEVQSVYYLLTSCFCSASQLPLLETE